MAYILFAVVLVAVVINIWLTYYASKMAAGQGLTDLKSQLEDLNKEQQQFEAVLKDEFARNREEMGKTAKENREEASNNQKNFEEKVLKMMTEIAGLQKNQLEIFFQRTQERLEKMDRTVAEQLKSLQEDNAKKLEQMRATVDEKLQSTLEKRLGESFKLVSERLEQVHKGLGEMQTLANGVGDLKKVLSNVKARGVLGELQLARLLEQLLTPDQYAQNVKTKPSANAFVEFAVKLPGKNGEKTVWLPIDSKFPTEDYYALLDAYDHTDTVRIDEATKNLTRKIKAFAKDIQEKYVDPPNTTDFAIMFLPIEGLYAEVLRHSGLFEELQREYRVVITGPTTLAALLNSLQMGFRTLAIEKRSSEVWEILGAVKTEFGKFGDILTKTQKKLQEASNEIGRAEVRTRAIERKLKEVQELPEDKSTQLLGKELPS